MYAIKAGEYYDSGELTGMTHLKGWFESYEEALNALDEKVQAGLFDYAVIYEIESGDWNEIAVFEWDGDEFMRRVNVSIFSR